MNDERCSLSKLKPFTTVLGQLIEATPLAITFVGEPSIGKTRLILSLFDPFNGEFDRRVIGEYETLLFYENEKGEERKIRLELRDTSGSEDEFRMRPEAYPGADLFIICACPNFAEGDERQSSRSIQFLTYTWFPEVQFYGPHTKKYLFEIEKKDMSKRDSVRRVIKQDHVSISYMGAIIPEKENREKMWEMISLAIEEELCARQRKEEEKKKGFFSKLFSKKKDKKEMSELKVSKVKASQVGFIKKFHFLGDKKIHRPPFPQNVLGIFEPSKFSDKGEFI